MSFRRGGAAGINSRQGKLHAGATVCGIKPPDSFGRRGASRSKSTAGTKGERALNNATLGKRDEISAGIEDLERSRTAKRMAGHVEGARETCRGKGKS